MSRNEDQHLSWRNLRGEVRTIRVKHVTGPTAEPNITTGIRHMPGPPAEPTTFKMRARHVSAGDLEASPQHPLA
jgi:hypothetical protein